MASNSSLVDQPFPVLMSINRTWLSDEPERMYGGQKSMEAMLKQIHERAIQAGLANYVPPAVVVLKNPE